MWFCDNSEVDSSMEVFDEGNYCIEEDGCRVYRVMLCVVVIIWLTKTMHDRERIFCSGFLCLCWLKEKLGWLRIKKKTTGKIIILLICKSVSYNNYFDIEEINETLCGGGSIEPPRPKIIALMFLLNFILNPLKFFLHP